MRIRVNSVPHTGTRFLTQLLRRAGIEVLQVHFNGMYQPVIWDNKVPAIVPLRDKEETIASWTRRGRSDPDFEDTWQEMEDYVEEFDPYLFHIDGDESQRIEDVKRLEELIGQPLNPDFSIKVGHFEG